MSDRSYGKKVIWNIIEKGYILRYNFDIVYNYQNSINLGGIMMKYNIVYVVMCEGEVEFASTDEENAKTFADNQMYNAREEVLDEWGNDDPTENDIFEADYQAGFNGDYYEVIKIDISNRTVDDTLELPDGNEVEVSDILEKLQVCE